MCRLLCARSSTDPAEEAKGASDAHIRNLIIPLNVNAPK